MLALIIAILTGLAFGWKWALLVFVVLWLLATWATPAPRRNSTGRAFNKRIRRS